MKDFNKTRLKSLLHEVNNVLHYVGVTMTTLRNGAQLATDLLVTVDTLWRGSTAGASKRLREAGTLGFFKTLGTNKIWISPLCFRNDQLDYQCKSLHKHHGLSNGSHSFQNLSRSLEFYIKKL